MCGVHISVADIMLLSPFAAASCHESLLPCIVATLRELYRASVNGRCTWNDERWDTG